MTQEEKQLLLKDLCARLPYGVKVKATYLSFAEDKLETRDIDLTFYNAGYLDNHWIEAKPYLRPMSSMTEEEKNELLDLCCDMYDPYHDTDPYDDWGIQMFTQHVHNDTKKFVAKKLDLAVDWLNAHHFDHRGLIEKGLALEAPEGMYNTKQ